jgi:lipid A 3-O-deacylase
MLRFALSLFFVFAIGIWAHGQRVQWQAFRFIEENDFFNVTQRGIDRYYTQGMRFEFLYQVSKRSILEKLVIPISRSAINRYSVSITQQIYTPQKTDSYFFVGDMPYAGSLYLSKSLESKDSTKQTSLTTRLDVGLIGPAALAEGTQKLFHELIKNDLGVGWETQLRNDILLNYSVKAEHNITKPANPFRLELRGEANLGTALISVVPGVNVSVGNWYSLTKKFGWQLFFKPEVRWVVYNALLQGGILNQMNADEIYSQFFLKEIKPLVYSHSAGFQIRYNKLELLYRQVNLTREFAGQKPHYYGSIMLTFPMSNSNNRHSK